MTARVPCIIFKVGCRAALRLKLRLSGREKGVYVEKGGGEVEQDGKISGTQQRNDLVSCKHSRLLSIESEIELSTNKAVMSQAEDVVQSRIWCGER